MNTLMEQKRLVKQQQLDSEYIAMKEAVEAARTKQLSAEAENSRLQKLLEDSLKMFHHQRQQEKAALEGTSSGLDETSFITSAMVATRNSSSFSNSQGWRSLLETGTDSSGISNAKGSRVAAASASLQEEATTTENQPKHIRFQMVFSDAQQSDDQKLSSSQRSSAKLSKVSNSVAKDYAVRSRASSSQSKIATENSKALQEIGVPVQGEDLGGI